MDIEILNSRISVFEIEVNLGNLAAYSSKDIPGFISGLLEALPTLKTHRCVAGESGGFVNEMRKGTDFAHVLEHVILELEHLADPDRRVYRGWTRKKEGKDSGDGIYIIHYEAKDFLAGKLATMLAVQLIRDLIAGRPVQPDAIVRDMENPMAYFRKEAGGRAMVPDMEVLWESARIAYKQAGPLAAPNAPIDLPAITESVLSEFSAEERQTIRQLLDHVAPHLPQIHERWLTKFSEFGGKYIDFIRTPIESIDLTLLFEAFENNQLESYNQTVTEAGRQLARQEVPFFLVLHAVHLYEECMLSRLMQVIPNKEQLQSDLVNLDSLFHNYLLTISLSYFSQLHYEHPGRKHEAPG